MLTLGEPTGYTGYTGHQPVYTMSGKDARDMRDGRCVESTDTDQEVWGVSTHGSGFTIRVAQFPDGVVRTIFNGTSRIDRDHWIDDTLNKDDARRYVIAYAYASRRDNKSRQMWGHDLLSPEKESLVQASRAWLESKITSKQLDTTIATLKMGA